MRSRIFLCFVILGVFVLPLIELTLIAYGQVDSSSSKTQEDITKLFPNSKITWSKEIEGEMVNFRATSTALAIMTGNRDKKSIEFINFEDTTEWSIDCHGKSCLYYDIIGEDESKLWIRGLKNGRIQTRVIKNKGEEIINMNLKSWLDPSPSEKYYYTSDNPDSYNQLKVYDSNGKFLWKRKTPGLKVWFVHALSDSELIYMDYQGCFMLDAVNGDEIWKIPKGEFGVATMGLPNFFTSLNGKYFILTDNYDILSIENKGQILWVKKVPGVILAASISNNGKFVTLYTEKLKAKDGKKLELLDNFNNGDLIWDSQIKTPIQDVPSDIHGLKINYNIVSLTPGMVLYYTSEGITTDMQTFCFEFDSENGELLNQYTIDGVLEIVGTKKKNNYYWLVHKGDKKEIFRFEQVLNK